MRKLLFLLIFISCLSGCGFKLRGAMPLAPQLHSLYLETADPYGQLAHYLRQFLKMSGVSLAESPVGATSILNILSESTSDQLIGINGTQQTRQYNLVLTVTFQVSNTNNRVLVSPQTVTESRALTIINDQILASSNEAMNLYTQMRQAIVYDIMSRLSSEDITAQLTAVTQNNPSPPPKLSKKKIKQKITTSESE
jgi:LPS-assembly lipoprotein